MESFEHLQRYINIITDYLKKKGITDFSKFKVALTHDKPHFLKWEYSIVKPTDEYLLKEFKIDLSEPRKKLHLELEYIYINNPELLNRMPIPKVYYFNRNGDIVDPSSIDVRDKEGAAQFEMNANIETILKIDIESKPTYWTDDVKNAFHKRLSVDNGLLKYIIDSSPHSFSTNYPESKMIRVLVAYPKKSIKVRANEIIATKIVT